MGVGVGTVIEQEIDQRQVAAPGGRVERGAARTVGALRPGGIGAAIEQQADDRVVAEHDGRRQRTPAVRPRLADAIGRGVQRRRHVRQIAARGGDGQVVGGAAIDEQARGGDVAAIVLEQRDVDGLEVDRRVAGGVAGPVEMARVDVGPAIEEQRHRVARARGYGAVQRRRALPVADLEQRRVGVEPPADRVHLACCRGAVNGVIVAHDLLPLQASSPRTRERSRSIWSGVAPRSPRISVVKASATSPSPENTTSAPASRRWRASRTWVARARMRMLGVPGAREPAGFLDALERRHRDDEGARLGDPRLAEDGRVGGVAVDRVQAGFADFTDGVHVHLDDRRLDVVVAEEPRHRAPDRAVADDDGAVREAGARAFVGSATRASAAAPPRVSQRSSQPMLRKRSGLSVIDAMAAATRTFVASAVSTP